MQVNLACRVSPLQIQTCMKTCQVSVFCALRVAKCDFNLCRNSLNNVKLQLSTKIFRIMHLSIDQYPWRSEAFSHNAEKVAS